MTSLWKIMSAAACVVVLMGGSAEARRGHHYRHAVTQSGLHPQCNITMPCITISPTVSNVPAPRERVIRAPDGRRHVGVGRVSRRGYSNVTVVGGRPAGCPYQFCGCGVSIEAYGRIIPFYNLAANWLTRPRAAPGPGMAEVVHRHHVRYILANLGNGIYRFKDYNSGGHMTRIHDGPIRGTVVDPRGGENVNYASGHGRRHYAKRYHQRYAHARRQRMANH